MIYISNNVYLPGALVVQVAKWGNSLAIRIPVALAQELGLQSGDEVDVIAHRAGNDEPVKLEIERKPSRQEILDGLKQYRGRLLADGFRFNREEANAR